MGGAPKRCNPDADVLVMHGRQPGGEFIVSLMAWGVLGFIGIYWAQVKLLSRPVEAEVFFLTSLLIELIERGLGILRVNNTIR